MEMTSTILSKVESAMRGKSPVVGIPQEGEPPFCFQRTVLTKSLKGLRIIDAGIQLALDGKREHSRLVVYAVGENVKAVRSLVPIDRNRFLLSQWDWAEKERAKLGKPTKPRVSAKEKKLIRLRKQLAKLGDLERPRHLLLDDGYNSLQARLEHDARQEEGWRKLSDPANGYLAEGTEIERPLTMGETWAKWKRQANARRWIQSQARLAKAGKMTTTQLYRTLADRGVKAKKWPDLNTAEREHCEGGKRGLSRWSNAGLFGYLDCLWEFCGLSKKPWGFEAQRPYELGAKHYAYWLEELHVRKELQSMIAGIEAI